MAFSRLGLHFHLLSMETLGIVTARIIVGLPPKYPLRALVSHWMIYMEHSLDTWPYSGLSMNDGGEWAKSYPGFPDAEI